MIQKMKKNNTLTHSWIANLCERWQIRRPMKKTTKSAPRKYSPHWRQSENPVHKVLLKWWTKLWKVQWQNIVNWKFLNSKQRGLIYKPNEALLVCKIQPNRSFPPIGMYTHSSSMRSHRMVGCFVINTPWLWSL